MICNLYLQIHAGIFKGFLQKKTAVVEEIYRQRGQIIHEVLA
jgi:hypothetical protein